MRFTSAAIFLVAATACFAQGSNDSWPPPPSFTLSSTTFGNDTLMPLSTIHNDIVNGSNACSVNGAPGGNESPELFWKGAPPGTQSFVVIAYDTTAAFTHWGMYNISGALSGLPENAGANGSKYGQQIVNDFEIGPEYDGPCPPANVAPDTHRYQFTVYALDTTLMLAASANFPANAETLYHALIRAGIEYHILASATLIGLYSATPAK